MADLMQQYDGWSYYTDGTVIGPDNTYYQNGEMVWSPDMSASSVSSSGVDWTSVLTNGIPRALDSWAGVVKAENTKPLVYGTPRPIGFGVQGYGNAAVGGQSNMLFLLLIGVAVLLAVEH